MTNTSLSELHLQSTTIGDEEANWISESLKTNESLTLLDLGSRKGTQIKKN